MAAICKYSYSSVKEWCLIVNFATNASASVNGISIYHNRCCMQNDSICSFVFVTYWFSELLFVNCLLALWFLDTCQNVQCYESLKRKDFWNVFTVNVYISVAFIYGLELSAIITMNHNPNVYPKSNLAARQWGYTIYKYKRIHVIHSTPNRIWTRNPNSGVWYIFIYNTQIIITMNHNRSVVCYNLV